MTKELQINDIVKPKPKRVKHNYINNRQFFLAMEDFYNQTQVAREKGIPHNELPVPSDYIGKCIFDIAHHMGFSPKFNQYSWLEEMIGDAIEDCLLRIRNFTPANAKKNAFGYFSMIAWNAFLRRIAKEKKQQYISYKAAFNSISNATLSTFQSHDDVLKANMIGPKDMEMMANFIAKYEEAAEKKKQKIAKPKKNLEKLEEE